MNEVYFGKVAAELNLPPRNVAATARLLAEGATVPFIARYRKEATGSLDEVAITGIRERLIQPRGAGPAPRIHSEITRGTQPADRRTENRHRARPKTLTALEDIYQPYRPKRRTRAMIAKEKGLEPLADLLFNSQATVESSGRSAGFCGCGQRGGLGRRRPWPARAT